MTKQEMIDDINKVLEGAYTDDGIRRWWLRPRKQLDDKTPKEVFDTEPQRIV
jgi:uncharacterized protein (DUF2384 family)